MPRRPRVFRVFVRAALRHHQPVLPLGRIAGAARPAARASHWRRTCRRGARRRVRPAVRSRRGPRGGGGRTWSAAVAPARFAHAMIEKSSGFLSTNECFIVSVASALDRCRRHGHAAARAPRKGLFLPGGPGPVRVPRDAARLARDHRRGAHVGPAVQAAFRVLARGARAPGLGARSVPALPGRPEPAPRALPQPEKHQLRLRPFRDGVPPVRHATPAHHRDLGPVPRRQQHDLLPPDPGVPDRDGRAGPPPPRGLGRLPQPQGLLPAGRLRQGGALRVRVPLLRVRGPRAPRVRAGGPPARQSHR
ncbi:ORF016 [Saltwater crocodilepox virus]|nr:ORF016 [Saltwater crocodilepox virus]